MNLDFFKMNACGNDFLIVFKESCEDIFSKNEIKKLSDYKRSVGFEQLIIISESSKEDANIRIFNSDGTEVEACGNGTRCVAKLILQKHPLKKEVTISTVNRVIRAWWQDGLIAVDMGKGRIVEENISFIENISGDFVDVGNPHVVIKQNLDPFKYGPIIENDQRFPNKTNVNFVEIINPDTISVKTWERGVGRTLSCGTGACASFFLLETQKLVNKKILVKQAGGNLIISLENENIIMSGEANINYKGTI